MSIKSYFHIKCHQQDTIDSHGYFTFQKLLNKKKKKEREVEKGNLYLYRICCKYDLRTTFFNCYHTHFEWPSPIPLRVIHVLCCNEKFGRSHLFSTSLCPPWAGDHVLPCLQLTVLLFSLGLCFLIILLCWASLFLSVCVSWQGFSSLIDSL